MNTSDAKSAERRAAILDSLTDHVLAQGLSAASLRPLARAAGISDRMLLYYFKDKAEVIAAVIALVAARMIAAMEAHTARTPLPVAELRTQLAAVIFADEFWPYMRLWLEIASLAARGDAFYRTVGEQIGRGFLAWGRAQLDSKDPDRDAARLLVSLEGMLVLKSLGLDDVCAAAG
jgi:AcrR family transcriptional regulator